VEVIRRAVALYKYIDTQLSTSDGKRALGIIEDERVVKEL